jgi:hypothetical protein
MVLFFFFGIKMIWEGYKNEEVFLKKISTKFNLTLKHAENEQNEVEMRISALESGLIKKQGDSNENNIHKSNNDTTGNHESPTGSE